ncbi:G-protein beta WD-40 repeats containing protein [Reticulomyxa filosa]|uniref:G-protein beta WD-40 repeats containing protein n=1 Tax=Reticulomyxa filosa TaxID=46433 RepID=X6PBW3_RETFI|nr:G-protein beta WD-40 repeats containing protein [Reticulomyxa filosa]|eukprot:ETO35549.1 G-protein beta WD-40 repeats containing protein [Reticulomyxa filosa]
MATFCNEKQTSVQQELVCFISSFLKESEEEAQIIIQHWIRTLHIRLGWIQDFDILVGNYVMFFIRVSFNIFKYFLLLLFFIQATTSFMLESFCSKSKLIKTFIGHIRFVNSIDCSTFDNCQCICSGSYDKTVRVWNIETNEQIQLFNGHSSYVYCVKFSSYHYHNNRRNVICSSSADKTIRFWDIKDNQQFQIFNGHTNGVNGIEFSPFNNGRYLCSGSDDKTICLWDVETSESLHVFNGHENNVCCVAISPLQSNNRNNNDNKSNRHEHWISVVKYGSNELGINGGANTILSGSNDSSVRLWDIRSGQQIQVFNGHKYSVYVVEYSPFVVNNIEIGGNSNVICSGSYDNTIRFWDIRSNKKQLYVIKGDYKDDGILCLKFFQLKKNRKGNNDCGINLCYGSNNGPIRIWG